MKEERATFECHFDGSSAHPDKEREVTERNSSVPLVAMAALASSLLLPGAARAADFYSGKTITFVVSSDAGGGYEAVGQVPSELPAGTIVKEETAGYLLHGRLLRPARVIVSMGTP